jgi:hypothetical protein
MAPGGPQQGTLAPIAPTGERDRAAAAMRAQWGPGRRLFEFFSRPLTDVH